MAPVVARLADALDKALDDPTVRLRINALGEMIGQGGAGPRRFQDYVEGEMTRWEPVLKAAAAEQPK